MTLDEVYGTRPDLLPRSMVRVVRAGPQSVRSLTWEGRPGVELLDLKGHLQYERESIGQFPRSLDGTIDWEKVPADLVVGPVDSDAASLIRKLSGESGRLVFFWESLAVPSVEMDSSLAFSLLSEIIEKYAEFWIYIPGSGLVVECAFSGAWTAAQVSVAK